MKTLNPRQVVTEKTSDQIEKNKLTVMIDQDANKIEVKSFYKKTFDVDVDVNIMNVKGKKKRRGKIVGHTKSKRKAILTLKNKEDLEKLKEIRIDNEKV